MRVSRSAAILLVSVLAPFGNLGGQTFQLRLHGPDQVHLNQTFEVPLTLTTLDIPEGQLGAEGWQVAVAHENLRLLDLTFEGTTIEELLSDAFVVNQITTGAGNRGYVSGVVLSLDETPVTLPVSGTEVIARAQYLVIESACEKGGVVEVRDGLVFGDTAWSNQVFQNNAIHVPRFDRLSYLGCRLNSYRLSMLPSPNPVEVMDEVVSEVAVRVILEQRVSAVDAWSLAISHDPGVLQLLEVTLDGTGIEELFDGAGFAIFETTSGPANVGFIAEADLSAEVALSLPALVQPLLEARYRVVPASLLPAGDSETQIRFADTLRGSGGLRSNNVSPEGFLQFGEELVLSIRNASRRNFLRGDASADGIVDIADPLITLFFLFLQSDSLCREAADTNANTLIEIADAIQSLAFLFLGARPPEAPFPACGTTTQGDLNCDIPTCSQKS